MDFSNYFLIVADYVNWAKNHDIPVGTGRGSSVGSVVSYALGITDVDPIKYNLLFERFINPEQVSMPDIDIDFGAEGREDVVKYIVAKYGRDHVGQIAITVTARNSSSMEVVSSQVGIHACGLVISKSALCDIVPLYNEHNSDIIAIRCELKDLESYGLVKFDILGLKTLDVIRHTEKLIRNKGGEYATFNITNIPEDDQATFKLFAEGNTENVFQFESEGIKNILRQAKPGKLEDLIALNSMYRPGSIYNLPRFYDCKNGKIPIVYPDPCLEDILIESYGVIVYQEQIIRIIQRIGGYSLCNADILRREMGKSTNMESERVKFIESAAKQKFSSDKAADIFDMLIPYAGYAFNKSHAAAYAKIAYQTAYLKANFPKEFEAANNKMD